MTKRTRPSGSSNGNNNATATNTAAKATTTSPNRARTTPQKRSASAAAPSSRIKLVWASLVGVAALIVVAIIAGQPQGDSDPNEAAGGTTSDTANPAFNLARRIPDDVTAQGAVDAPVVIVEFADYRCPFCGVFDRDTLPTIVKDYVDKGAVRFEWRDLPVFGDQSIGAAVAARAAGEQGMFWEYHTALFAAAPERGHPELPNEKLIEFARQVGVPDIDRFTMDLASPELAERVRADYVEGTNIGISSTPIFLVNETPIAGAQPLSAFLKVIDEELAKADRKTSVN
ncbi:DsbA family protein [Plantibacter sp. YIM 135347]|uniref:DsbA family protein n=1 Tax=Plantibacter sp. YIM 135347 TaxID=3423919 RepID=UPI003D33E554